MTDIFLSYAHADLKRVESLAAALEAAGFSVWWDKRLIGGARYAEETETALRAAKAVVVAWSEGALKSMWVTDEAMIGRDACRLVPVCLDECEPPIGFRQVQTIAFKNWNGDQTAPQFTELVKAVERLTEGEAPSRLAAAARGSLGQRVRNVFALAPTAFRIALGGSVILAAVLAFLFLQPHPAPHGAGKIDSAEADAALLRSITVMPFDYRGSSAHLTQVCGGITESIRHHLRLAGFMIKGYDFPAGDKAGELTQFIDNLSVDFILRGAVTEFGQDLLFNITLIDARSKQSVLTIEHREPNRADLEIVSRIVSLVMEKLRPGEPAAKRGARESADYYQALGLASAINILATDAANRRDLDAAINLLQKVVAAEPNGEAYATLAYLLAARDRIDAKDFPNRARAEAAAQKAFDTLENDSNAHFARAVIHYVYDDPMERLARTRADLDAALKLDRGNIRALKWMSNVLILEGDYAEGLKYSIDALALSPYYKDALGNKVSALLLLGRRDEARSSADQILKSAPDWGWARRFRASLALTDGDLVRAVDETLKAEELDPRSVNALIESIAYANAGLIDEARAAIDRNAAASGGDPAWTDYKKRIIAGDIDGGLAALAPLLGLEARSSISADALTATGFMRLYRGENAEGRDRCREATALSGASDPDRLPALAEVCTAIAEARLGNPAPARQALAAFERSSAPGGGYKPYWTQSPVAALHAALGEKREAMTVLSTMVSDGWRTPMTAICRHCVHLSIDDPRGLFGSLQSEPEFKTLMTHVRADLDAQREQIAG